ncbi:hypothetical protein ABB27_02510 [Stenotrophomonas terrae]|jgi:hypothetical protein|uniref:Uncharacterized protein n=1 Tax=Stenotrophomonas terrae TaxID=405446 RepID=A0A0R0CQE9_9GAMM|nr:MULTISPECIES: hypothetical protein [Stenotrophomonas]KRG71781.1 hypothetical protein ABB27_02510 [Stenotrophomonas terrae]
MDGDPTTAPWWAAGGAFALWAVREIWGVINSRKKERTETDANVTLVSGLTERIDRLEQSQARMGTQLDEEIKLRREAQEEAHRLRMRVQTLEGLLRGLGAVIPPEPP